MGFWKSVLTVITGRGLAINASVEFKTTGYTRKDTMFTLERMTFTDKSTIGELYAEGEFICYTLEDTCREKKVQNKTAIPSGKYEVIVNHSERFGKDMPLLLTVPGFEGVRIHPGNTPEDTDGCILVGLRKGEDQILDSVKAFALVFEEINKRLKEGKLYISVIGGKKNVDLA